MRENNIDKNVFGYCSCKKRTQGGTQMSRGYQARPKICIIRVVFQDQALYACTSFRGVKTCKIEKKGVFLVI